MERNLKTESIDKILRSILAFIILGQVVALFFGFIFGLEAMKLCERQNICDIGEIFSFMLMDYKELLGVVAFFLILFGILLHSINKNVFGEIKRRCN